MGVRSFISQRDEDRHHIEDVGKILLQVQRELSGLKHKLVSLQNETQNSEILSVIERAEADLHSKAMLILRGTDDNTSSTLSLTDSSSKPRPSEKASNLFQVATENVSGLLSSPAIRKQIQKWRNDQIAAEAIESTSTLKKERPVGKNAPGKLRAGKLAQRGLVLPEANRKDPTAPPPVITESQARKGLLFLLENGFIPKNADVTPALVGQTGVLHQRPITLHENKEQHIPGLIATGALGQPVNIKLDVNPPVQSSSAAKDSKPEVAPARPQYHFKTASLFTDECEQVVLEDFVQEKVTLEQVTHEGSKGDTNQDPRSFDELLDTYSLHEFIIRRGVTVDGTPEFVSFKRRYSFMWGAIHSLIVRLEELLARFSVPLARVQGQRIVSLAEDELHIPTPDELLACLTNEKDVAPCIRIPGRLYRGPDGIDNAASKIQATWKMYRSKKQYKHHQRMIWSANAISKVWRKFLQLRRTRERAQKEWENRIYRWKNDVQLHLLGNWSKLKTKRRVEIHLPRWTNHEQQISRIFAAANDPNLHILYISPFILSEDIQGYYNRLVELKENHSESKSVSQRIKFLFVEKELIQFRGTSDERSPSCVADMVYYSPRLLRRIKSAVHSWVSHTSDAYIVPAHGGESFEELRLAVWLRIALFASSELEAIRALSTVSGSKRVFATATGVECPEGLHDVYSRDELCMGLSKLLIEYPDVPRWLVKLDNHHGGHGISWIDREQIPLLHRVPTVFNSSAAEAEERRVLNDRLRRFFNRKLEQILVVGSKSFYVGGVIGYIQEMEHIGCAIEACHASVRGSPSANLLVEPDGNVTVLSTHDQIFGVNGNPYAFVGSVFPQATSDSKALYQSAIAIGHSCLRHGLFGYIGVDFVVVQNSFQGENVKTPTKLLAVDLNLGVTKSQSSFQMFDFLVDGNWDSRLSKYEIVHQPSPEPDRVKARPSPVSSSSSMQQLSEQLASAMGKQRYYTCFNIITQPALSSIQHRAFFNLCRLQGVSFDMKAKEGTVFMLSDSLSSGVVGVICTGDSYFSSLRFMTETLAFLDAQSQAIADRQSSLSNNLNGNIGMLRRTLRSIIRPLQEPVQKFQ